MLKHITQYKRRNIPISRIQKNRYSENKQPHAFRKPIFTFRLHDGFHNCCGASEPEASERSSSLIGAVGS